MGTSGAISTAGSASRTRIWLGVLLVVVGFLGHFFAARAIGGSYIAFRDHIAGFFLILVVTGAVIAVGLTVATARQQTSSARQFPPYKAPRLADGHPDLNGLWQALVTANIDLDALISSTGCESRPLTSARSFSVPQHMTDWYRGRYVDESEIDPGC